jgi:hypothetical protein
MLAHFVHFRSFCLSTIHHAEEKKKEEPKPKIRGIPYGNVSIGIYCTDQPLSTSQHFRFSRIVDQPHSSLGLTLAYQ